MDNIEIKKISLKEIDQLQEISRQTFQETFSESNSEENMKSYLEKGFSNEKLTAEIIDENGKVVGKIEGEGVINRRLALFFIIDYCLIIFYVYLNRFAPQYKSFKIGDYISEPFFWLVSEGIFFACTHSASF